MTTVLAVVALLAALASLAVAVHAWRKADDACAQAHTHPSPPRPPQTERRGINLGPPRQTGERRRHAAPDDERARRADRDDPQWTTRIPRIDDPQVPEAAPATRDLRLPPPGTIGR